MLRVALGESSELSGAEIRRYGFVPKGLAPHGVDVETVFRLVAPAFNYPRVRDAIAVMSDTKLERGRQDALLILRFVEVQRGRPLPLLPALPFTSFLSLTQLNPKVRLLRASYLRMIRDQGFSTFEEALTAMRGSKT